jgi:calcium channel MID1
MQFPKLTPLQARFAASLAATVVLILIYFSFFPPHFAYAVELDSLLNDDHNHHRILQEIELLDTENGDGEGNRGFERRSDGMYEPSFVGVDRGIIGRADDAGASDLQNNVASRLEIGPDKTVFYTFPSKEVNGSPGQTNPNIPSSVGPDLLKQRSLSMPLNDSDIAHVDLRDLVSRQSGHDNIKTVWVSVNVCNQPISNSTTTAAAPQMTLFISQSPDNTQPGPGVNKDQTENPLDEGYIAVPLNASGDVFIGLHSPKLDSGFTGNWSYELAASIDAPYHYYNSTTSFMSALDTDSKSALLVTGNLTVGNGTDAADQKWMQSSAPFSVFVFPFKESTISGLGKSFCGLSNAFNRSNMTTQGSMTQRGDGGRPKQEFLIQSLNASSSYQAILGLGENTAARKRQNQAVVGGGGQLWSSINFLTKSGKLKLELYQLLMSGADFSVSLNRWELSTYFQPFFLL